MRENPTLRTEERRCGHSRRTWRGKVSGTNRRDVEGCQRRVSRGQGRVEEVLWSRMRFRGTTNGYRMREFTMKLGFTRHRQDLRYTADGYHWIAEGLMAFLALNGHSLRFVTSGGRVFWLISIGRSMWLLPGDERLGYERRWLMRHRPDDCWLSAMNYVWARKAVDMNHCMAFVNWVLPHLNHLLLGYGIQYGMVW